MLYWMLAVVGMLVAAPVAAQDASGKWDVTFNTQEGQRNATLSLKKEGETLAGLLGTSRGELAVAGTQKATSISLRFDFTTNDGTVLAIVMTGTQDGDSMSGSADYGGTGQGEWAAKRSASAAAANEAKAPDVSGTWTLDVTTPAGGGTPTFTFTQEEEKLSGRYSGQLGEAPITGTIKGSEIAFAFDASIEGNTIRVAYTGTVDKDGMKGTVKFGDLGEGTFTGRRRP